MFTVIFYPAPAPKSAFTISQFAIMLVCDNITPFGNPVVPDEYGRNATSLERFLSWTIKSLKTTPEN